MSKKEGAVSRFMGKDSFLPWSSSLFCGIFAFQTREGGWSHPGVPPEATWAESYIRMDIAKIGNNRATDKESRT